MVDQEELALGGAAVQLREQGYAWTAIAAALGTFPGRVREAAMKYLVLREMLEQRAENLEDADRQ